MTIAAHRCHALFRLLAPWPVQPVYALIYVTERCDAHCRHCFLWQHLNSRANPELTLEQLERLAASMGPLLQVTLTGGSPELRNDLPAIAAVFHRHCRPVNLTICMNGYHTDKIRSDVVEILRSCPDQNLTVGLSLDGLGSFHDDLRGMKGLFERVVDTFQELGRIKGVASRLRLTCAVCVSELNWESAEATAAWAHEHLPIDLLKPILVRGTTRDPGAHGPHCAAVYDRLVAREAERAGRRRGSLLAAATQAKEAVQQRFIADYSRRPGFRVRCSAGRQTAVIRADGTVMGCEMRQETLGDLRGVNMDLRRIWRRAAIREFREKIRREKCACSHHCFVATALLRSPRFWPSLACATLAAMRARLGSILTSTFGPNLLTRMGRISNPCSMSHESHSPMHKPESELCLRGRICSFPNDAACRGDGLGQPEREGLGGNGHAANV